VTLTLPLPLAPGKTLLFSMLYRNAEWLALGLLPLL
jgi:hypothetical protein